MSIIYLRKPKKNTPRAARRRQYQSLKQRIKSYLRKTPGVTNVSKVFNVSEKKIYQMITSNR